MQPPAFTDPEEQKNALLGLAELDPEFASVYHDPNFKSPLPSLDELIPRREETRQMLKRWISTLPVPADLEISNQFIPAFDGHLIEIRTYVPKANAAAEKHPLFFVIHGGGFCLGNIEQGEVTCRTIASQLGFSVVTMQYRLAPEYPYPFGLNDTYETLKWVVKNASTLDADPTKGLLVSGISSGANFAAIVCIRARDDPEFEAKITGQILQIPSLTDPLNPPEKYKDQMLSLEQNSDSPILSKKDVIYLHNAYKPLEGAIPLHHPDHTNLPPAFFQIAGFDTLRDDGIVYEKVLKEAGVPTKSEIYPGVPHAFATLFPTLKISQKWNLDMVEGIKWLLEVHSTK